MSVCVIKWSCAYLLVCSLFVCLCVLLSASGILKLGTIKSSPPAPTPHSSTFWCRQNHCPFSRKSLRSPIATRRRRQSTPGRSAHFLGHAHRAQPAIGRARLCANYWRGAIIKDGVRDDVPNEKEATDRLCPSLSTPSTSTSESASVIWRRGVLGGERGDICSAQESDLRDRTVGSRSF